MQTVDTLYKPNFRLSRGSKQIALNSLHQLHKKFEKNSNYKIPYTAIIREYLDLNHMSLLESTISNDGFYLPHHEVFKNSSSTTKLRVVFNPSIADKESLNSQLMVGATIQDDLFSLIIRFRFYTFVIIRDIEKIYRQFLIREQDRKFRKILWQEKDYIN